MMALWAYVKAFFVWSKWTIQGLFIRDPDDRPGSDDQWSEWLRHDSAFVMCDRCRDYFDLDDDDDFDQMKQTPTGEWVCGMCRLGREVGQ